MKVRAVLCVAVLAVLLVVLLSARAVADLPELTVTGDPPCTTIVELDDPTDRTDLVVPADGVRCVPVPGGPCSVRGVEGRFDFLGRCICETTPQPTQPSPQPTP